MKKSFSRCLKANPSGLSFLLQKKNRSEGPGKVKNKTEQKQQYMICALLDDLVPEDPPGKET